MPECLGTKALLTQPNRLGSLALKQPTAQFHAFLSEHLCTVCPHGHGRWSPETCKLPSVASHEYTGKSLPPPHLPKIPQGDIQTPLMSYGRLFTADEQRYMVGRVKVKCERHGEQRDRLARVSHDHTPPSPSPSHMPFQRQSHHCNRLQTRQT